MGKALVSSAPAFRAATHPARLAPLFAGHRHFTVGLRAGLAGELGKVWHVRSGVPEAAVVELTNLFYFGGDARSAQAEVLVRAVAPRMTLVVPDRSWRLLLGRCFPGVIRRRAWWSFGDWSPEVSPVAAATPPATSLEPLIERHLERAPDMMVDAIAGMFPSRREFLERGFGYVAIRDGEVGCIAATLLRGGDEVEVAVLTDVALRRLGLGTATVGALLRECARRGLRPHWTAENARSRALARRAGFGDPERFLTYSRPI